jgi:zinc protease
MIFTQVGLGKLTADELSRVLTGKIYSAGFSIDGDAYQLSGATRPADLQLQLQVLTAYLTDPGLRAAPFERIKAFFPQILTQQLATPGGAFGVQAASLLAGGDKREGLPSAAEVAAFTMDELKQGVIQGMASGPIDIVMVGDVTVDDAIKTVASTFAALPTRAPAAQPLPGSDQRRFPAPTAQPVRLTHTGPAEQALAYVAWPTTDAVDDRTEARKVNILDEVLKLRVLDEIREKQALAYSPGVSSSASSVYKGYGSIFVAAEIAADKIPAFYAAVDAITASLRDAPVTEDELNRARLPVIEALRRSQAGNEYWLGQLEDLAAKPASLEQIQSHISDLESFTVADIQAAARQYLKPDTAWKAEVVSDKAATQ